MNLIKFAIAGAVVGLGVHYITKKGTNGRSILEDLADKAPEWFGAAKQYAVHAVETVKQHVPGSGNL